jgi:ubiquinol-cytochrome c reductase cytochrome b subunit
MALKNGPIIKESSKPRRRLPIKEIMITAASWVDERTRLSKPVQAVLNYPVSQHVQKNILTALGGLIFTSFLLQIISGLLMTFYYSPSLASAYNSVDYITYILPAGWLIRGIHVYNSSAIFILMFLHLLRTFFATAYKKPREITWISGVFLLLITVGFAFTGALLPWDQDGYWATIVGTGIAGSTPVVGDTLLRLMRGGNILGQISLTRFYFAHTALLPGILLLLIGLHLSQLRHGPSQPQTERGQKLSKRFVPFFPNRLFTHGVIGLGFLVLLIFLSWNQRAPLDFPADSTSTTYTPRPEWYFLSLFQLLHYFPGRWEIVASQLIPFLIIGSMIALPFVDRNSEHRPWRKPITTGIAIFYIFMLIFLTLLAFNSEG